MGLNTTKLIQLVGLTVVFLLAQLAHVRFDLSLPSFNSTYSAHSSASVMNVSVRASEKAADKSQSEKVLWPENVSGLERCFEMPPTTLIGRSWKCDTLPGYEPMCANSSSTDNFTSLSDLLSPPSHIPTWKAPPNLTVPFQDLAKRILKPFPTISQSDVDHVMTRCGQAPLRFKIEANQVFVLPPNITQDEPSKRSFASPRRLHSLLNLQAVLRMDGVAIDYLEGAICRGDGGSPGPGLALIWNTQYQEGEKAGIPWPLMEFSTPLAKWDTILEDAFQWRNSYPWQERKKVAVFRGGSRNCYPQVGDELARAVTNNNSTWWCGRDGLVKVANTCGNGIIDASVSDKDRIPMKKQEAYKMIIYAEGNFGWANRFATLLAMENVVIRQFNSPFEEWYTAFLQPWVHYVPVDHLFNFLPSIVRWAIQHDDMIQQISRNADLFAKTFLSVDSQLQMMRALIEEYHTRFRRDRIVQELQAQKDEEWVSLEALSKISFAILNKQHIPSTWDEYETAMKNSN